MFWCFSAFHGHSVQACASANCFWDLFTIIFTTGIYMYLWRPVMECLIFFHAAYPIPSTGVCFYRLYCNALHVMLTQYTNIPDFCRPWCNVMLCSIACHAHPAQACCSADSPGGGAAAGGVWSRPWRHTWPRGASGGSRAARRQPDPRCPGNREKRDRQKKRGLLSFRWKCLKHDFQFPRKLCLKFVWFMTRNGMHAC